MQLHVQNLGRIREARLEIRPFTVFVGENGTNKTWTMYALHTALRRLSRPRRAGAVELPEHWVARASDAAARLAGRARASSPANGDDRLELVLNRAELVDDDDALVLRVTPAGLAAALGLDSEPEDAQVSLSLGPRELADRLHRRATATIEPGRWLGSDELLNEEGTPSARRRDCGKARRSTGRSWWPTFKRSRTSCSCPR